VQFTTRLVIREDVRPAVSASPSCVWTASGCPAVHTFSTGRSRPRATTSAFRGRSGCLRSRLM